MGLHLYELTAAWHAVADAVEDLDATDDSVRERLDAIEGELVDKLTSIGKLVRHLETLESAMRAAALKQEARAAAVGRRAEGLRDYARHHMVSTGLRRAEVGDIAVSLRDNPPSVVLDDMAALPDRFWKLPAPPEARPDKSAISAALRSGEEVPGAHLERTTRLEIR